MSALAAAGAKDGSRVGKEPQGNSEAAASAAAHKGGIATATMDLTPTGTGDKKERKCQGTTGKDSGEFKIASTGRRSNEGEPGEEPTNETNKAKSKAGRNPRQPGYPKRPLSAYNFFFQLARDRLVDSDMDPVTWTFTQEEVNTKTRNFAKPRHRSHRKTHGKIGFKELAFTISNRWNKLPEKYKAMFQKRASHEKLRYEHEVRVWKFRQKHGVSPPPIPPPSPPHEPEGVKQPNSPPVMTQEPIQSPTAQVATSSNTPTPHTCRSSDLQSSPPARPVAARPDAPMSCPSANIEVPTSNASVAAPPTWNPQQEAGLTGGGGSFVPVIIAPPAPLGLQALQLNALANAGMGLDTASRLLLAQQHGLAAAPFGLPAPHNRLTAGAPLQSHHHHHLLAQLAAAGRSAQLDVLRAPLTQGGLVGGAAQLPSNLLAQLSALDVARQEQALLDRAQFWEKVQQEQRGAVQQDAPVSNPSVPLGTEP